MNQGDNMGASNDKGIEFDAEMIEDFFIEFSESYAGIECDLVKLEAKPADKELVNSLFRAIHSIKSNLRMVGLGVVSDFVHIIENLLDDIRHDKLIYNTGMSDVILLSVDRVKSLCQDYFEQRALAPLDELGAALQGISQGDASQFPAAIAKAMQLLDPNAHTAVETMVGDLPQQVVPVAEHKAADLAYFKQLSLMLDAKLPFWQGRTERLLKLTAVLNRLAGQAVDPEQLEAAVYLHDLGMAFLPDNLIGSAREFTPDDVAVVQSHVLLGYDWISRIAGWEAAAQMIRQHHERVDGSGYPDRLKAANIHDGAQILAIADTFEAMTQERAVRTHKRPIMRAILEINQYEGLQFAPKWVEIFNQVARKLQSSL